MENYFTSYDTFISLVCYFYSAVVIVLSITFSAYSLICTIIFKKRQNKTIIFEYLYANTLCDILMLLVGNLFTLLYFFVSESDIYHSIYFVCGISFVRSLNMCSGLLSLLIMTQRLIFVYYQNYWLKRHTTLIITTTIIASFLILTPFFLINFIKETDEALSNLSNETNELWAHLSPHLNFFRSQFLSILLLRFYQLLNFFIVLFALLFSALTLRRVLKQRGEFKRQKRLQHLPLGRRYCCRARLAHCSRCNAIAQFKKHTQVTYMIVLLTITFIVMQMSVLVLHELYQRMDTKLTNNKLFLLGASLLGFVNQTASLCFFYKFDKNVRFYLRRPVVFYNKLLQKSNKSCYCIVKCC